MASSSKGDAKQPKTMDVTAPGKSAPPASSKPIIVTNRPILRRDPMMAPTPDGLEKDDMHTNTMLPPVSRVGKQIKVAALEPLGAKKAAEQPKDNKDTSATAKPVEPANNVDQKIALEVGEEALAGAEEKAAVPEASVPANAPAEGSDMLVSDATPIAAPRKPMPIVPAAEAVPDSKPEPASEPESEPATTSNADSEPTLAADTPKPEAGQASAPVVPPTQSSVPDDPTDDQLAPNQAVEDAQRKQQQEEAARQAEVEKVVTSKQYFLPIKSSAQKHGTRTAILVLILVILLALLWLDVVLDAGLVHINGVQPLTHFFSGS